jgi:hypothetical protein
MKDLDSEKKTDEEFSDEKLFSKMNEKEIKCPITTCNRAHKVILN